MASLSSVVLGLIAALGGAGVAVLGKIGLDGINPTLAAGIVLMGSGPTPGQQDAGVGPSSPDAAVSNV